MEMVGESANSRGLRFEHFLGDAYKKRVDTRKKIRPTDMLVLLLCL